MQINPIQLNQTNPLIVDYRQENESILKYFDYKPFQMTEERFNYIAKRSYEREALSEALLEMNQNWGAEAETLTNIERLKEASSVVVIGGQQAGLATGPMYTINKIISIIHYAKEQTEKWQKPVIPLFWIAGEDHDFDEINHIHLIRRHQVEKHATRQYELLKKSVSHMELDQEKTLVWIMEAFAALKETIYTKDLLENVTSILQKSRTFVDFFARFIFMLCEKSGIVLVDSAAPAIRQLEQTFFAELIKHQPEMAKSVLQTVQALTAEGYTIPLDVDVTDGHLFYHDDNNERILLQRLENIWNGKHDEVSLTTEQLLYIAKEHPERLSNNVITRPLMQEYLFPTLAFIAGDGEISYWAALKEAFHIYDMEMPPVIPRLSFTYLTARSEKLLQARGLSVDDILNGNVASIKTNWLMTKQSPPVEVIYAETKKEMAKIHEPLRRLATDLGEDLGRLADRNLEKLLETIAFLERKTTQSLTAQYQKEIEQFDELGALLKPNQVLQERIMNPLHLLNEYGESFIHELLMAPPIDIKENHYCITL